MKAQTQHPTGSVLPLVAVMLTLLLLMLAMVVDLGWINVASNELKVAAEAAALAGASQLLDEDILLGSPDQSDDIVDCRDSAETFANYNTAAGRNLLLDRNDENDPSGGIVVGYIQDPLDLSSPLQTTGVATYNSVQVTTRLSEEANGPLELLLGAFTGRDTIEVAAQATATLDDRIVGFASVAEDQPLQMLPYSLKDTLWYAGLAQYQSFGTYISIFPERVAPGNFGSVDIGPPNNSTADLERQILYGITAQDLAAVGGMVLEDPDEDGVFTKLLEADPGMSSAVKDEFASIIGQTRLLPIHMSVTGQGNNAIFEICGFVGVRITGVHLTGNPDNRYVAVEPCAVTVKEGKIDPDAPRTQLVYALSLTR